MVLDPMTMALVGGGSLLGAGGQLAGGLLSGGGMKARDMVIPTYDPALNLAAQASSLNTMSGLGFGNIGSIPDPLEQLIGRIQSAQIDEKTKRRAIAGLSSIRQQVESGVGIDEAIAGARNSGRITQTLGRLGMSTADIPGVFDDRARFNKQMESLRAAGLDDINTDTILNRYRAANTASQLIGAASDMASTGEPQDELGRQLLARDQRAMNDLQTQLGLRANFGGINPAVFGKTFADAQMDQNLRVLEQALGISGAIQTALSPYTAAAGQDVDRSMNAAQIAAQQAQAANQLRAQMAQNQAQSTGAGIAGALGSLGSGLSNLGLLSSLGGGQPTGLSGSGATTNTGIGPGPASGTWGGSSVWQPPSYSQMVNSMTRIPGY